MKIKSILLEGLKAFQFSNINKLEANFEKDITIVFGTNGSGKAISNTTSIKVPGGWSPLSMLSVGDTVTAWDGTNSTVTGIFPQGVKTMYRVWFADGRYLDTDNEHLWGVYLNAKYDKYNYEVMSTLGIMEHMEHGERYAIPLAKSELHETYIKLPMGVHAYSLGATLLEDNKNIDISTLSNYKHLDRVLILRGIIDAYGEVIYPHSKHWIVRVDIPNDKEAICDEIRRLAWSIGCTCTKGYEHPGGIMLHIRHDSSTMILDPNTHGTYYNDHLLLEIIKVAKLDKKEECTCIAIDHPDKLYVAGDYIVTHNTSMLNELTPLPAVRTSYEKSGRKVLQIEHNGSQYILSSDFNNRVAPHSFICDGEELNVSGVTGVQEELIRKHFNYTPTLHSLIYMQMDICRMGPAERRTFFLNVNPVDLKHLFIKHKKVQSKIKEYKSSLSMYHGRRVEIEAKMITAERREQMYEHRKQLIDDVSVLDKMIYAIDRHITSLKEGTPNNVYMDDRTMLDELPTKKIKNFYNELMRFLSTHTDIDKEKYQDEISKLNVSLRTSSFTMESLGRNAMELKKEIDEYHTHLAKTSTDTISKIEDELKTLKTTISGIHIDPTLPVLTSVDIADAKNILTQGLREHVLVFTTAPVGLWSPVSTNKCKHKLDILHRKVDDMSSHMVHLENSIKDIEKEYTALSNEIAPDCKATNCNMKNSYLQKQDTSLTKLKSLRADFNYTQSKYARYSKVVSTLGEKYHTQIPFIDAYRSINDLVYRYPSFSRMIEMNTLYDILKTQPNSIVFRIESIITNSENHLLLKQFEEKASLLQKELEGMMESNSTSKEFLTNLINEKVNALNDVLSRIAKIEYRKKHTQYQLDILNQYEYLKNELAKLNTEFETNSKILINVLSIKFHENLFRACVCLKNDINEQLRNMESHLKEQEMILSKYEEVMSWINKIDGDKWKYELIEKALSPNSGIPHKYLLSFINTLIHNTNYFIQQIVNYKLQIKLLPEDSFIDFNLPVELEGGVIVKDISRLSKGQKECVSLSFIMAILLQLKMLDKIPVILDEIGSGLCPVHAVKLIEFLRDMVDRKILKQVFMVNHASIMNSGFSDADIIVLRKEDVMLPTIYNENVSIS